jgi:hypothetical protein
VRLTAYVSANSIPQGSATLLHSMATIVDQIYLRGGNEKVQDIFHSLYRHALQLGPAVL